LLESYQQALRWDNISTFPMWVNGVKPVYDAKQEMHLVTLKKNEEVSFRLPAYQSVRLYSSYKIIKPEDVQLSISDGSGLAVEQKLYESTDGQSLIFSPQISKPSLIHLKSVNSTKPLVLGLYVSRTVTLGEIAPYRNLIPFSKNWVLFAKKVYEAQELYWRVPANQTQKIHFKGKAIRIALRHRLQYEAQAGELIQDYRIRYQLDGKGEVFFDNATSVESSYETTINFKRTVLGRQEELYIEIPAGEHTLKFSADRMLYMQVLSQTEHDYLVPELNEPRKTVQEVRKQDLLTNQPQVIKAATSKKLVHDNSHKDAEMVGIQHLKQAALKRQDYQPILREAEQLRGFRSFYRDLLPNHKASLQSQYTAYFAPKTLESFSRPQAQPVLAQQHLQAVLNRIGKSIFIPLSKKGEQNANEYYLPDSAAKPELRLIVDKRYCGANSQVFVQFDQQKSFPVALRCDEENITADAFLQTFFEVSVKDYQHLTKEILSCKQFTNLQKHLGIKPQNCESEEKRRDFYRLISQHFKEGELIKVGHFDLALTKKIKRIKIWLADASEPVHIALQYRSSKEFNYSEQSYLARFQETNSANLLNLFQRDLKGLKADTNLQAEQQLKNQWQPLKQLIMAQARLYKAAVAKPELENKHKTTPQRLANFYALARQTQASQHWEESLEYWGKVVQHTDGLERHQAQFEQAQILYLLGESYLAETLWRYLFFYADESISKLASEKLRLIYEAKQDYFAMQALASSMVVKNASRDNLYFLIKALSSNGQYRFALLLGWSMVEKPPLEALLRATYQMKWWQSYQHILSQLADSEQDFWQGLQAQAEGDYPAAITAWKTQYPEWSRQLLIGVQLRDNISMSCGKQQAENYQAWLKWQQQQPSLEHW
ncbi:MAG: hypothetical protein GQ569_14560, partial [Methylococcaceae bacterium]|nr:hypothetical protein [Methylococcaceae bacterium]